MNTNRTESPLEAICRRARERDAEIIANPSAYTADEVACAANRQHDRIMLTPAAVLRYD